MIVETVDKPSRASNMARRGKSKVLCLLLVSAILVVIGGAYYHNVHNMSQTMSLGTSVESFDVQAPDSIQTKYEEVKHFLFDTSDRYKNMGVNPALDDEDDEFSYNSPVPTSQIPLTEGGSDSAVEDEGIFVQGIDTDDMAESEQREISGGNKDGESSDDIDVDSYKDTSDESGQKTSNDLLFNASEKGSEESEPENENVDVDSYTPGEETEGNVLPQGENTFPDTERSGDDLSQPPLDADLDDAIFENTEDRYPEQLPESADKMAEPISDGVGLNDKPSEPNSPDQSDSKIVGGEFFEVDNEGINTDLSFERAGINPDLTQNEAENAAAEEFPLTYDQNKPQVIEEYNLEQGISKTEDDQLLEQFDQNFSGETEKIEEAGKKLTDIVFDTDEQPAVDEPIPQLVANPPPEEVVAQPIESDENVVIETENRDEVPQNALFENRPDKVVDEPHFEIGQEQSLTSDVDSNSDEDSEVVEVSDSVLDEGNKSEINEGSESETDEERESADSGSDFDEKSESESELSAASSKEQGSDSEIGMNDESATLSSVVEEGAESESSESSSSVFDKDLEEWLNMKESESVSDSEGSSSESIQSQSSFTDHNPESVAEDGETVNEAESGAVSEDSITVSDESISETQDMTSSTENLTTLDEEKVPSELSVQNETGLPPPLIETQNYTAELIPEKNMSVEIDGLNFQSPQGMGSLSGEREPEVYQQPIQSVLENDNQIQVDQPQGMAPVVQLPSQPQEGNLRVGDVIAEEGMGATFTDETPKLDVSEHVLGAGNITDGRTKVLILTSSHFHPSFLDTIFGQNEKLFYVVEPGVALRQCLELLSPAESVFSTRLADMLFDILRCDFQSPNLECFTDSYAKLSVEQKQIQMRSLVNERFCWKADNSPTSNFVGCKEIDRSAISEDCKAATYVGVRTNYMHDIKYVVLLMKDPMVKVIHLIQDPRSVAVSLLEAQHGIKSKYDMLDLDLKTQTAITEYCRTWVHNIVSMHSLSDTYKSRYKIVRFEDMESNRPIYPARLYQFLDIPRDDGLLDIMRDQTAGAYVESWKYKLTFDALQIIQYIVPCIDMMQAVGYTTIDSHPELLNQGEQITNYNRPESGSQAVNPPSSEQQTA